METGIALAFSSCVVAFIGLFYTIKSGLTRVERERLNWLEGEYPKKIAECDIKDRRISELNQELFNALRANAELAKRLTSP